MIIPVCVSCTVDVFQRLLPKKNTSGETTKAPILLRLLQYTPTIHLSHSNQHLLVFTCPSEARPAFFGQALYLGEWTAPARQNRWNDVEASKKRLNSGLTKTNNQINQVSSHFEMSWISFSLNLHIIEPPSNQLKFTCKSNVAASQVATMVVKISLPFLLQIRR